MEDLTSQKPFFQLQSFLKDPDKHTFTRTGEKRFLPIWSIAFPALSLEDIIYLPEEKQHGPGMVHQFRQEAIEIMDSDMFRNGLLRGNQKTRDIEIEHIEEFVLPMAAVIHITRDYLANSWPEVRSHTFDGKLSLFNELQTAWHDLMIAFNKVAEITLKHGLIRPDKIVGLNPQKRPAFDAQIKKLSENEENWEEIDRLLRKTPAGIRGELVVMEAKSLAKAHLKDVKKMEENGFDTINFLIHIFLCNVPKFSDYLIAKHIFDFISQRQNSTLKGLFLPEFDTDALKKKVKKQRNLAAIAIIQ